MFPHRIRGRRASGSTFAPAALGLTLLGALALTLCLPASSSAAEPAPPGFFGVNTATYGPGDFEGMAAADAGMTRVIFPFQVMKQGRNAPYNWSFTDNLVRNAANNGLQLIPIVYGSPPWVSAKLEKTPLRGQSKQAWDDLLVELVRRYGPYGTFWVENVGEYFPYDPTVPYNPIGTWQIWNEPNSVTWWGPKPKPKEYATLLRRSAAAIHSVDPGAQIMSSGVVSKPTNEFAIKGPKFLKKLFAAPGVRDVVDVVAYHPYARSVSAVRGQIRAARRALRSRGAAATPILITEIGWGTKGPKKHALIKSNAGQNRVLRDTFRMVLKERRRLNIAGLLWYHWKDGRDDLCRWCETSGLVDRKLRPKRIFDTFRSIATR